MSYYRIGERNTRKLIERDSPLIVFGEETEARRPVRLSPEAVERLRPLTGGRQPLFDTAEADRIVGPLYPLYREPEAHHVAYRLEQRAKRGRERAMSLRFAYNTNGTASHRLDDALMLMAETGYAGVALTLDHNHFDPFAPTWRADAEKLAKRLRGLGFGSVIETGARYLLDPRAKHEPTLVTADPAGRARRIAFLHRAIDVGEILGSEAVSFWAGVPKPGVDPDEARDWLRAGLEQVVAYAGRRGVVAALEPEPGMLVETVDDYADLARDLPGLKLALDTGHLPRHRRARARGRGARSSRTGSAP